MQSRSKMKLPVGISDFQELIQGKYDFADKTLFVKEILDDSAKIILVTRPRRFGKTLNMSMLHYFLQSHDIPEENLFEGLAFCGKQVKLKHDNITL